MIFSNIDTNPRDTIQLAEAESRLWLEAHGLLVRQNNQAMEVDMATLPQISGRWCYMDEPWKTENKFLDKNGIITLKVFDGLMGARNTRASFDGLMENMRNLRQFHITVSTDYYQVVNMILETENSLLLRIIWKISSY